MFTDPLVIKLSDFISSIGIPAVAGVLDHDTRFPGLDIECGSVVIDEARLIHRGNILHEAGHIAVHDPVLRPLSPFKPRKSEELSALAWSYAAVVYLDLKPELVFYPGSYHGWADTLLENFAEGRFIGVPMMQLHGMTVEPRQAAERGVTPYPHMIRWLR